MRISPKRPEGEAGLGRLAAMPVTLQITARQVKSAQQSDIG